MTDIKTLIDQERANPSVGSRRQLIKAAANQKLITENVTRYMLKIYRLTDENLYGVTDYITKVIERALV
jgi:hypothetical protein